MTFLEFVVSPPVMWYWLIATPILIILVVSIYWPRDYIYALMMYDINPAEGTPDWTSEEHYKRKATAEARQNYMLDKIMSNDNDDGSETLVQVKWTKIEKRIKK